MKKRLWFFALVFFFGVVGSGVLTANAYVTDLPVEEGFQAGELPHNTWHPPHPSFTLFGYWTYTPWSFTTNGEARIQVVADSSALTTSSIPVGSFNSSSKQERTGGVRSKGNYYRCDTSMILHSQAMLLGRASAMDVTFMVYESTTSNGTYSVVSSNVVSTAAGTNDVWSGELNLPLTAGRYYLMTAGWSSSARYTYLNAGYQPDPVDFGTSLSGYTGGFPQQDSLTYSANTLLYFQKVRTTSEYVVRMDDSVNGSAISTNSMDLSVDLTGYSPVMLEFRHRESPSGGGDEAHAGDGIFFSDDSGATFTKVYDLDVSSTTWQQVSLNVHDLAISHGLAPAANFVIRFQQEDNYSWPQDGREFDDIRVYSNPDLENTYLSLTTNYIWKGFSSDKLVATRIGIRTHGGSSTVTAPNVKKWYSFRDNLVPIEVQVNDSLYESLTLAAMEKRNYTRYHTITIPAATHLTENKYRVYASVSSNGGFVEGNSGNGVQMKWVRVNHYSGWLWFDDVKADITIAEWGTRVSDSRTEHWISGTGTFGGGVFSFDHLMVDKNLTTLDYTIDPTDATTIPVSITARQTINRVDFWLDGDVNLSRTGAYGDVKVLLPSGLGISTASDILFSPTFIFANKKLTQGLYPNDVVMKMGNYKVTEETKPLVFDVDSVDWNPATGRFSFIKDKVLFVRARALNSLEAYGNCLVDPDWATKKSNAQYYRGVYLVGSDLLVDTGLRGDAQLSVDIKLEPIELIAHFPYNVHQQWNTDSVVSISNDLIVATDYLSDPSGMSIRYSKSCNGGVTCALPGQTELVECSPKTSKSFLDGNGGILTEVVIDEGGVLQWGIRMDSKPAQLVASFSVGNLYLAGHFIRGDQSGFDVNQDLGPAEILLSGTIASGSGEMERPSTSNYADGFADYAGLNMRVKMSEQPKAHSVIGGVESSDWLLTERSKYYVRWSGVSGIHEAQPGTFPSTMKIYDYDFGFSNYGLSYLSGVPEESRINGNVVVKHPCDISMDFENLMLNCVGELGEAELDNSPSKHLVYWDAKIQPLSLFFAPTESSTCGNAARKLCMGLTTKCANVDQTLSGVLAFLPSGNLGSPADRVVGVPSRLAVPNVIELAGPNNDAYYFNPVAMPYYNNYEQSGDLSGRGWINFAGNVDVSFFNDLQVHFHTSASTNSAIAKIYMMGGWNGAGSATFFNSDPDAFDLENIGYPLAAGSYEKYRLPSENDDTYRVRAKRTWLGVIKFDYPLQWSTSAKSFKSPRELQEDLLVVQVQHQVDYLSGANTEISFGMQYDGVPQINLCNMGFNAVDEATGMASAFTKSVGDQIHKTIESGMSAMDDMLSDLPEMLFDPVFDRLVDPLVDDFYADIYTSFTNHPSDEYYGSIVTNYIYGIGGAPYSDVASILTNMADTASTSVNLIGQVSNNLDQAVQLINAFADAVSMTNGVVLPPGSEIDGLLNVDGGNYQKLTDLGIGILEELSATLYDSIKGTVEEKMTEVLSSAAPTLSSITEVLLELRDVIQEVQGRLNEAGVVAKEISDVLNSPLVLNTLDTICDEIMLQIKALSERDDDALTLEDYPPEVVKAMLRRIITDRFYASVPCAKVQQVMRSQLYEIEAMVQESIDSSFQQLNKALKDIVSEYLAGIDKKINGALGDLSDVMGAGQIEGYAHIRHDALNELRLDGKFQWKVPDEMEFNAFLVIKDLNSSMPGGCGVDADSLPEVTLGTTDFALGMMGSDIRADISTKFAFAESNSVLRLMGMGGSFEMTEGEVGFESFAIDEFYAAVAFGKLENYLSANIHCTFTSYEVEGGIFLGKTCTIEPFSWDPDVQAVLGEPPFTGIYVYGEGWMPIVDYGCLFRVKAGVGAGLFAFVDGPVGGKIFLGADGEALCVVNVAGEVTLVGVKDGDDLRMNGKGKISGRAGSCPFCIKFKKTVKISYDNGEWDADY